MLKKADENDLNKSIKNFYQDFKKQREGFQSKAIYSKDKEGQLVMGEKNNNMERIFRRFTKSGRN